MGRSADGRFASALGSQVAPGVTGNGGNLTVETGQLIVRDGAQIGTATFGSGTAGSLTVSVRESVEVMGRSANGRVPSGLFTSVDYFASTRKGTGAGGNLTLETGRLIVRDGAAVSAGTYSAGPEGTLEVRASESVEGGNGISVNWTVPINSATLI